MGLQSNRQNDRYSFNELGSNDDYDNLVKEKTFESKRSYALKNLKRINGTIKLARFMESLVDGRLLKRQISKQICLIK
jgi:hypothetical protein